MSAFARPLILVASGTANTGSSVVKVLSALNTVDVRAMTRDPTSDKAQRLSALPNVSVVKGDFDDFDSVKTALDGVSRALLVSDAFSHNQFEREANFMKTADQSVEAIVRISTASILIRPGTTGAYGRAHHGLEANARDNNYKVIHMNPNWFLTNMLMQADEIKTSGTITYPVAGNGEKVGMIAPDDVGSACAHLLTLPLADLQPVLAAKNVELHGPELVNFQDCVDAISKSVGYEIKINPVDPAAWAGGLMSMGIPRVFANSFLETVQVVADPSIALPHTAPQVTSDVLLESGWKGGITLEEWANSPLVKGALKREQ